MHTVVPSARHSTQFTPVLPFPGLDPNPSPTVSGEAEPPPPLVVRAPRDTPVTGPWGTERSWPPMDRRRILLVAAVFVAALGAVLVFLYVQGADTRAEERFDTVEVLRASHHRGGRVDRGRAGRRQARARGGRPGPAPRRAPRSIPRARRHHGDADHLPGRADHLRQVRERRRRRVGAAVRGRGQDRDLGQPDRPVPGGRIREPRFRGRDLPDRHNEPDGKGYTRLLLDRVTVLAVGTTTPVSTTTTDETGASTTEQLPRTLLTLSVDQRRRRRSCSPRATASWPSVCSPRAAWSAPLPP